MAATRSGDGYWIATASGRILDYGDAAALGSAGRVALPVVGVARLG